jgi:polyisoprenoid-binding protein YceI
MRLLPLLFALAPLPALAAPPVLTPAEGSRLGFETSYDGEPIRGRFDRFQARIAFDPADLANSRFEVVIDLASADTGNEERDEVLLGPEFFAVHRLAEARYEASRFQALPGSRFVAEGTLTLRGVSLAVPLSFRWTEGPSPVLEGTATVPRLAFGVGAGRDWRDTRSLPDEVKVSTRLVLVNAAP